MKKPGDDPLTYRVWSARSERLNPTSAGAPFRPSLSSKRSASRNSSQSDAGERHFEAIVEKANRDDVPSGQSLRTHITHQRKSTPRFFRLSRRREVLELVMKQKEFFIPPPCSRT
uniref:Uncharacterized protein n=1 Tax=Coccidioides posadasii RMSCC 3488 TaxID=454284 RepID=A0A0J6FII6_COCPO|nr:hypothetical protein CPAG_04969 [Coccidioides posadasii RMSCC 3488]